MIELESDEQDEDAHYIDDEGGYEQPVHTHIPSKMRRFGVEREGSLFPFLHLSCASFLLVHTQVTHATLSPFIFHLFEASFQLMN